MSMQPHMQTENMLVFQESSIDEMGAFLIYAPIDLPTINSIVNGGDAKKVFILPLRYHYKSRQSPHLRQGQ